MTIATEQVKRLCAASGVDEIAALSALERQDGDLLEALLELERQGSAVPPAGGGFYSTRQAEPEAGGPLVPGGGPAGSAGPGRRGFVLVLTWGDLWKGLKDLFHKGRVNRMEVWRKGEQVTAMPLLVLLLLLACFPQIMIPLLLIGWVLGFRYRLAGPDLPAGGLLGSASRRAAEALDRAAQKARRQSREKRK